MCETLTLAANALFSHTRTWRVEGETRRQSYLLSLRLLGRSRNLHPFQTFQALVGLFSGADGDVCKENV